MLPLHAATTITIAMCMLCIGYGVGYIQGRKSRKTVYLTLPPPKEGNDVPEPPTN